MTIFSIVLIGAAIIDLPKSTRAYLGAPTCGYVEMQPADLCRYQPGTSGIRSRGRNEHQETLLAGGFAPQGEPSTAGRVSITDYEGMRDIRRGEVRLNLIAEVIALAVGLLMARSLIKRLRARIRTARSGTPTGGA